MPRPLKQRELRVCVGCGSSFEELPSVKRSYCSPDCYQQTQLSQTKVIPITTEVVVQPSRPTTKVVKVTPQKAVAPTSPVLKVLDDAERELDALMGEDTSWDGKIRNSFGDVVAVTVPLIVGAAVGVEAAVFFTHGGWSTDWVQDVGNCALALTGIALEAVLVGLTYSIISLRKERYLVPSDVKVAVGGRSREVKQGYQQAITTNLRYAFAFWCGLALVSAIVQFAFLRNLPNANVTYDITRVAGITLLDLAVACSLVRRPMSAQEWADRKVHKAQQVKAIVQANIEVIRVRNEIVQIAREEFGTARVSHISEEEVQ